MKLLLHTCCAPCSIQAVEALSEEGLRPLLYWYNPNIHPHTEYTSRLTSLVAFAEAKGLPLMEDNNIISPWSSVVKSDPPFGDCHRCYRQRFERAAALTVEKGYDAFSTTLLISPYQKHDLIREMCEELAAHYGVSFLYRDFRPRFRLGQKQAREAGYYMQKYCGCGKQ